MNLVQVLESATHDCPDRTAIIEEETEVSYRELWRRVDRLAKAFLELGIKQEDRIAICVPNCQEYIYAFLASLKINAIAVPLKQTLTSYELKTLLKDCKPSLLITDDTYLRRKLPFDPILETGKLVICSKHLLKRSSGKRAVKIEDLFKGISGLGTTFAADDNTIASINYTYRGYGHPLGVMLTHGNYRAGIETYIYGSGMSPAQRVLLNLPIFHIYPLIGCVLVSLSLGSSIIIAKRSEPMRIIELINAFKIHVFASVPTFYSILLETYRKEKKKICEVQHIFSGGSFLSSLLYQQVREEMGWNICQGYGLTESLVVTFNTLLNNRPETLGKIGKGLTVKIVGNSGEEKKNREIGEIAVKGKSVMAGYYKHPRETREVIKEDWCYTGDLGFLDTENYLHFSGLKKQVAKVGGNIVDLKEVKDNLCLFPGVRDAKIDAIADELWGQTLNAEVRVADHNNFNARQLRNFLRNRLSSYKIPHLKIEGK